MTAAIRIVVVVAAMVASTAVRSEAAPSSVATPPAAARAGQEGFGPTLTLIDQPIAVAPDGDFTVLAAAARAATATEFAVDIYDRVPADEVIGPVPDRDPDTTFGPTPLQPDAAGDVAVGFTIQLFRPGEANPDPQWGHRLDEPGVYPVRIRLRDGDGRSIAVLMTSVVRLPDPDQPVDATSVALLVDVHRPPPDSADDRRTTGPDDQGLVLAPVLDALAERPGLPATFSTTPDTLARLASDDASADVLGALRTAVEGDARTVLDGTYVDLDVASLVAAGLGQELVPQHEAGTRTLTALLEAPSSRTWRLRDRIDPQVVTVLRALELTGLVLPDDAIDGDAGVGEPTVFDSPIGSIPVATTTSSFTVGQAAPNDPVLDAHRLLARLAHLDGGRALVPVDPDDADPETLRIVLDALSFGTPFFSATTVDDLLAAPTAPPAAPAAPPIDDLGAYPKALGDARASLASYASMVPEQPERTTPFEQTLLVSASRDLTPEAATSDARSVIRTLQEPFTAIATPERDTVTLAARDATFPLTIESSLTYPVRAIIELESSDRVDFPRNRLEVTLQEGRQVIDIQVRARTTGDTPVRISVRTPDDQVLLSESRYTIRSTAVSGVGVVLTVGAAAFLVVWWGRHWHRNRNTARHARRRRPRRDTEV